MSETDARGALRHLHEAADQGHLDVLCERLGIRVLSAFGSATREDRVQRGPADLDIAVGFSGPPRELELINALVDLCGYDSIDLLVIDRADPVARAEALTGMPLYEAEAGRFAIEQMAALAERRDTQYLRALDLRTLAG